MNQKMNRAQVVRLYVEELWSAEMVARALNVTPNGVRCALRAAGITPRNWSEAATLRGARHPKAPCSAQDCIRPAESRGLCALHYQRLRTKGDVLIGRVKGHGQKGSLTWSSWQSMKQRCLNPKATSYPRYGALGVRICEEWQDSFEAFFHDLGERPAGKTLDRINSAGHYEPGNVRWSTPKEQANNRRKVVRS